LVLFFLILLFHVVQIPAGLSLYNWQEFPIGGAPDNYPRFICLGRHWNRSRGGTFQVHARYGAGSLKKPAASYCLRIEISLGGLLDAGENDFLSENNDLRWFDV